MTIMRSPKKLPVLSVYDIDVHSMTEGYYKVVEGINDVAIEVNDINDRMLEIDYNCVNGNLTIKPRNVQHTCGDSIELDKIWGCEF